MIKHCDKKETLLPENLFEIQKKSEVSAQNRVIWVLETNTFLCPMKNIYKAIYNTE